MSNLDYEFLVTGYLRTAAVSVTVYEYLSTLPVVFRIYHEHWKNRNSVSKESRITAILLFLLRVTSMMMILFASIVFYHPFTMESCSRFYMLPPIFRALQTSISQAILGIRAINLSLRSRLVAFTVMAAYVIALPLQWVFILHGREPALGSYWSNCRAASVSPWIGVWMSYAIAMVYDSLTTLICLWFLLRLRRDNPSISNLFTTMIGHGLGYYIALTASNIFNTFYFARRTEYEAAGAPLGICISMIMSQRLLIHVYTRKWRTEAAVFSHDVLATTQLERSFQSLTSQDQAC